MNNYKNKIAITTGDPNGIGAEITIKALRCLDLAQDSVVIVSNKKILDFYGKLDKEYEIIEIPYDADIEPGRVCASAGEFSYQSLKKVCEIKPKAIVTAPVAKNALHLAGHIYNGQTEILQHFLSHDGQLAEMLFVAQDFRVLLLTRHCALKEVNLTKKVVVEKILNLRDFFASHLMIKNPKFALCGFNPHSGEDGILGCEEIDILIPAVNELRSRGVDITNPQPADTLFAKTIPYCDIDLKPYQYDPALTEKMLDEAGWQKGSDGIRSKAGQKMELGLLYNSDSVTEKAISEYLQSEYSKLGIKLNIHGEEEQSYRDKMKAGNFDMVFNICWGTPYDPQSSLAAMRMPVYGDYAAQQGLADKQEIDRAITEIMVSTDEAERQNLYTYVLTRLHDDAVYIPLTYECNKAIFRSDLKGMHFTQTQYEVPFHDMYIE